MKRLVTVLATLVFLAGLVTLFTPMLMKRWISLNYQQVSIDDSTAAFLLKSAENLQRVGQADFGVSLAEDTLSEFMDAAIIAGVDQIAQHPIENIGTVKVLGHSLKLSTVPMSLVVSGNLEFAVPERGLTAIAELDIRVFGRFSDGVVTYVPALAHVELLELKLDSISWWPFGLINVANRALDISIDAINGAIAEQSYSVTELQSLTQELVSFTVLDREVAIQQPTLGASALLIDNGGVMVIGEVFVEERQATLPVNTIDVGEFADYRDNFLSKADLSGTELQLGDDKFWMNPASIANIVLSDPVQPLSVDGFVAKTLGTTAARLKTIDKPTLALTISRDDVGQALTSAFSEIEAKLQSSDGGLRFSATPEVKLGEGVIHVFAPVRFSDGNIDIEAALTALVGVSLSAGKARLSAVLSKLSFDKIELKNLDELDEGEWPVEKIAVLASTLAENVVPVLNGLLQDYAIALPLNPLVIAGEAATVTEIDIAGRMVALPPPMLEDWVALIHPEGISVVAKISSYRAGADFQESSQTIETTYQQVLGLFQRRTGEVADDFDLHETGFRISEGFLLTLLEPVSNPHFIENIQVEAIKQSHKMLSAVTGPDLGISIPAQLVRELAIDQIRLKTASLNRVGIEVDENRTVIKSGNQALSIETAFTYKKDGLSVSGLVKGCVVVGYSGDDLSFRPVLTHIELDNIDFEGSEFIDVGGITGSVAVMANQLLPILNGAVDALKIELPGLKPFQLDLSRAATKVDGLTISPESFNIQAPEIRTPSLLITDERILVIADLEADYLKKRARVPLKIPAINSLSNSYSAYRRDFEKRVGTKFSTLASQKSLVAEMATDRIAETLENLWTTAGLKATYRKQASSNSARAPVAAISPNANCGVPCGKPSCDRNRACKPRKECKSVSEVVTVPVTVVKEVCEPVTSTVQVVEQQCRQTFKNVPLIGRVLGDLVCAPVNVTKNVTKTVCKTVKTVEKTQKNITKQVCEEVADAACLAILDKCTIKWKTYDLCALPFNVCTETLRGFRNVLAQIDFDKVGYASTDANVDLSASLDASSALQIRDDLRALSISPKLTGAATVNAKLKFEARASALLGCVPMKPLELKNYRASVPSQSPQIEATISPNSVSEEGGLTLDVNLAAVKVSGRVPPPFARLLADNPDTLVTCPLIGVPLAGLAAVTDTKITKDALTKAIRSVAANDDITRFLLEGKVDYSFNLPTVQFEVPTVPLNIGVQKFNFQPELDHGSIRFSAR